MNIEQVICMNDTQISAPRWCNNRKTEKKWKWKRVRRRCRRLERETKIPHFIHNFNFYFRFTFEMFILSCRWPQIKNACVNETTLHLNFIWANALHFSLDVLTFIIFYLHSFSSPLLLASLSLSFCAAMLGLRTSTDVLTSTQWIQPIDFVLSILVVQWISYLWILGWCVVLI